MAMDPDSIVKGFDIFEDQFVSMLIIGNLKPVQPFPLDERVEGLDAGVIIRITLVAVTELELFRSLAVGIGNVLASAIGMQDQRKIRIAAGFCLVHSIDYAGDFHVVG